MTQAVKAIIFVLYSDFTDVSTRLMYCLRLEPKGKSVRCVKFT